MRKSITKAGLLPQVIRRRHKEIKDQLGTPAWEKQALAQLEKEAAALVKEAQSDLQVESTKELLAKRARFEELSKNKKASIAPHEKGLAQSDAQYTLGRVPKEKVIDTYKRVVSTLDSDERRLRHFWDRQLKREVAGDKVLEYHAEQAIDSFRTPEEREAHQEYKVAARTADYVPTVQGVLEMEVKHALAGEPQATDLNDLYGQITHDIASEMKE